MTATSTPIDHSKNATPEKLRKIMERVERLLAIADNDGATPAEADTARRQAEAYMFAYRLDEAMLSTEQKAAMGIRPTEEFWTLCDMNSEFTNQYRTMFSYVIGHIDGYAVLKYNDVDGKYALQGDVFGFESDLAYGRALWSAMRIAFTKKLEPTLDPSVDEMENIYRMRNAGMERHRIATIMGYPSTSGPGKVTTMFKKACARHGEDSKVLLGKGNSVKNYRFNYAVAFAEEMWTRLYNLRTARGLDSDGTLVMANRKDEIMDAVYAKYPHFKPASFDPNAPKAAPIKYRKPRKERTIAYNDAAASRGRSAAQSVDLGPAGKGKLGS